MRSEVWKGVLDGSRLSHRSPRPRSACHWPSVVAVRQVIWGALEVVVALLGECAGLVKDGRRKTLDSGGGLSGQWWPWHQLPGLMLVRMRWGRLACCHGVLTCAGPCKVVSVCSRGCRVCLASPTIVGLQEERRVGTRSVRIACVGQMGSFASGPCRSVQLGRPALAAHGSTVLLGASPFESPPHQGGCGKTPLVPSLPSRALRRHPRASESEPACSSRPAPRWQTCRARSFFVASPPQAHSTAVVGRTHIPISSCQRHRTS